MDWPTLIALFIIVVVIILIIRTYVDVHENYFSKNSHDKQCRDCQRHKEEERAVRQKEAYFEACRQQYLAAFNETGRNDGARFSDVDDDTSPARSGNTRGTCPVSSRNHLALSPAPTPQALPTGNRNNRGRTAHDTTALAVNNPSPSGQARVDRDTSSSSCSSWETARNGSERKVRPNLINTNGGDSGSVCDEENTIRAGLRLSAPLRTSSSTILTRNRNNEGRVRNHLLHATPNVPSPSNLNLGIRDRFANGTGQNESAMRRMRAHPLPQSSPTAPARGSYFQDGTRPLLPKYALAVASAAAAARVTFFQDRELPPTNPTESLPGTSQIGTPRPPRRIYKKQPVETTIAIVDQMVREVSRAQGLPTSSAPRNTSNDIADPPETDRPCREPDIPPEGVPRIDSRYVPHSVINLYRKYECNFCVCCKICCCCRMRRYTLIKEVAEYQKILAREGVIIAPTESFSVSSKIPLQRPPPGIYKNHPLDTTFGTVAQMVIEVAHDQGQPISAPINTSVDFADPAWIGRHRTEPGIPPEGEVPRIDPRYVPHSVINLYRNYGCVYACECCKICCCCRGLRYNLVIKVAEYQKMLAREGVPVHSD